MADIAKNVPAVSNPSSPVCELTSDSPELTFPSQDDGSSLQELIESELALRISSVSSSPDDDETEDENTKFLLAERTHSFQNYTGNDTFFFSTLEEEELPTRLTLGNFDPFTTTIDTESSPSVECDNGMPVTPVTNHSPLLIPEIDIIPPDDLEQDDEDGWTTVGEAVAPENFVEQSQDIVEIQLEKGVEETQDIIEQKNQQSVEEEEEEDQFTQGDSKVECNVDVDNFNFSNGSSFEQETHDSSYEGDTVLKQSHEIEGISESDYNEDSGSLIAFEKDSLIQVQTNGMQAQDSITEDMFEGEQELELSHEQKEYVGHNGTSQETLENGDEDLEYGGHLNGTVDSEHDMCSSLSDSDRGETVAEKRIKKTKSETTVKKSKKTKKSEKENISVIANGTHSPNSNLTAEQEREREDDDDLSNVSVRALKQTYCSEANRSFEKKEFYDGKERIETGVSIKELRRSFGDLTSACDEEPERNSGATSLEDVRCKSTAVHKHYTVIKSNNKNKKGYGSSKTDSCQLTVPGVKMKTTQDMPESRITRSVSSPGRLHIGWPPVTTEEDTERKKKPDVSREDITTGVSVKQLKSSFSKFDQLTKKSVLHVRSVDASKVQKQFNQNGTAAATEQTSNCKSCEKQVFQMEQIKAERAVWHRNCFRCKECSKQLTVDTYSSHEGQLYCKPHFRELFKPKAVVEEELPRLRRPKLIVCENQPIELPPEVVRASDKPDLGLEELSSLDVKSRFHVFEKTMDNENEVERSPSSISVKRSPSILSKLAKFQKKGMDVGVTDESLNGIPYEESSSSSEEEDDDEDGEQNGEVNREVIRSNRKQRERPVSFSKMEDMKCRGSTPEPQNTVSRDGPVVSSKIADIKTRWETGHAARKEELREERKNEISNIRSRLFMGHQGKMKEMYEQAVQESEKSTQKKNVDIKSEKARSIKEKFERGEIVPDDEEDGTVEDKNKKLKDEDLGVFEAGISKKSRSIFLELDATAVKTQQAPAATPVKSPNPTYEARRLPPRQISQDIVRSSDAVEEVTVATEEISNKFRFFETYKTPDKPKKQFRITPPREGQVKENSPEREIYRNPDVVRSDDRLPDEEIVRSHTTSKMLSLFRQLEENANKEEVPEGPKPLKRFTPPPDYTHESNTSDEGSESEEEEEEEEEDDYESNPNLVKSSDKIEDEFLKQAQSAARAKALRAKFERWEEKENKANITNSSGNFNGVDLEINEQASIDTTKSLRARFESLTSETQKPKEMISRPKVNRFVEIQTNQAEYCDTCEKRVYPLEKIETGGKIFHKQCFRCLQCNCILRMETYTLNGGKPYCIPHFKQLFIAKGNYDEGFGLDQHKRKWKNSQEDEVFLNGNNNIESS